MRYQSTNAYTRICNDQLQIKDIDWLEKRMRMHMEIVLTLRNRIVYTRGDAEKLSSNQFLLILQNDQAFLFVKPENFQLYIKQINK